HFPSFPEPLPWYCPDPTPLLVQRVEEQPRKQLREEVGRLRGHVLTSGGDVADQADRRGPHQESRVISPRADAFHGLLGVARVKEPVEVGYVLVAQPERSLEKQRLEHPGVEAPVGRRVRPQGSVRQGLVLQRQAQRPLALAVDVSQLEWSFAGRRGDLLE